MNKKLCLVFSIIILLTFNGCTVNITDETSTTSLIEITNETESLYESPAEDFEYRLNPNGNALIITKYIGNDEHVVIPSQIEGVPVITLSFYESFDGKYSEIIGAFQDSSIKSVVIPASVEFIFKAFTNCAQLEQVTFEKNSKLNSIEYAFENCTSLKAIDFSNTELTQIGDFSFAGCTDLKEIKYSEALTCIGEKAFFECKSLEEIILPKSLEEIYEFAFGGCSSVKAVTIPAKLDINETRNQSVFYDMPLLEKVLFEDGREDIMGFSFVSIKADAEVIIPASVKTYSFYSVFCFAPYNVNLIFLGDCPSFLNVFTDDYLYTAPTVYYDPNTEGWDNCILKEAGFTVVPIE